MGETGSQPNSQEINLRERVLAQLCLSLDCGPLGLASLYRIRLSRALLQLNSHHPAHLQATITLQNHGDLDREMSATTLLTRSEQDLGVGTSKQGAASGGAQGGYMGLNAARPLTIAALLESPVHFVPQQHKQKQSEVPYTPINLKVSSVECSVLV